MRQRIFVAVLSFLLLCIARGGDSRGAGDREEGTPYVASLAPGSYRQWRQSPDGRLSVVLVTGKTTFAAAEGITVRCAVRNDTDAPMSVLRPFGDDYFAHSSGLSIMGPDGPVEYSGPQKDYVLGTGAFIELPARSVVEESMTIPKDRLPGIDEPGLYVIEYRYMSSGYPTQPAPSNFWTGSVDSNPVTVVVK